MKIKVLVKTPGCLPKVIKKGDWIDLYTAVDIRLNAPQANKMHIRKGESGELRTRDVDFDYTLIPLGVAMGLPKGMEAHVLPRSSTCKNYGIMCANSQGIIDGSYYGENDEWKFPAIAMRKTVIPKGTRIAQFRVNLSQKATVWQKLKWLFSSGVEIEQVPFLNNPDREGFGSTNKQEL